MKRTSLILIMAALASAASATLVKLPASEHENTPARADVDAELQHVLAPPGAPSTEIATGLNLADALTLERRASVWWDYARDVAAVVRITPDRLSRPRLTSQTTRLTRKGDTTLLVPIDRALMSQPTKPHQNPAGGDTTEKEARANVESFLEAHIVPSALDMPAKDGQDTPTLHKGVSVRVEGKEGAWVVQPGDIKVVAVKQASNGKILYLDGVVKY